MPMTVITVRNAPTSLRGDLTKWMQEISTGVYIGNFNSRIRNALWGRVVDSVQNGEATLSYYARSENGYEFETYNSERKRIDYDGIPLVLIPSNTIRTQGLKNGFSTASKFRKGRQMSKIHETVEPLRVNFVAVYISVVDDKINEISAVKTENDEQYEFVFKLEDFSDEISDLTSKLNLFADFVDGFPIVGFDFVRDFQILNSYLNERKVNALSNNVIDLVRLTKKENPFLTDYKILTVMESFGVEKYESLDSLNYARMIVELANKLTKFRQMLVRD